MLAGGLTSAGIAATIGIFGGLVGVVIGAGVGAGVGVVVDAVAGAGAGARVGAAFDFALDKDSCTAEKIFPLLATDGFEKQDPLPSFPPSPLSLPLPPPLSPLSLPLPCCLSFFLLPSSSFPLPTPSILRCQFSVLMMFKGRSFVLCFSLPFAHAPLNSPTQRRRLGFSLTQRSEVMRDVL